ncbi:MAG: superoxide dismutase [Caulobacterales bacterium]|nr:superoxide dismutase [Caulobacterales bacterium]
MFILPELPYAKEALEPTMSAETLTFHHDKHHNAYVTVMNQLLEGQSPESLEAVIKSAGPGKLFNQAAQTWNHDFFWNSMSPAKTAPSGELAAAIDAAFGSLAELKTKFVAEGVGHFASGWAWLVVEGGALKVISTHDAATTVTQDGVTPLLVFDVWEHAYYIDKRNDRKAFLEAWFDTLANWDFAAKQLAASKGEGEAYSYPKPQ